MSPPSSSLGVLICARAGKLCLVYLGAGPGAGARSVDALVLLQTSVFRSPFPRRLPAAVPEFVSWKCGPYTVPDAGFRPSRSLKPFLVPDFKDSFFMIQ